MMLLWTPPTHDASLWNGVAIPGRRASELFAEVIEPLQKDLSFRVALRDQHAVLWGSVTEGSDPDDVQPMPSIPGWALVFGEVERPAATPWHRLLNYARVVFPMVVLACGLLMTGWIRRRELALTELQSTFVAAVTHEFKSPITSIRLMMERITGGRMIEGDSPARYYAAISAETDRLEALVNRLLDAQQVQSGRKTYAFRRTALDAVLREALERMRPQAEAKQIDLELRIAPGVPPLLLDSESVFDAVRNLLENAIAYSPAGTRVDVELDVCDEHVVLTVSDQGIGVAAADAQRIFEPFYRSRHADVVNVHGTGLGLSLVRATALAHGGSASVSSDGTHGSRFRLAIPLIQEVVPSASPAAATLVDERRGQSS
jgi:signal transduction histidine kinase